jgi:hypothetical protein
MFTIPKLLGLISALAMINEERAAVDQLAAGVRDLRC